MSHYYDRYYAVPNYSYRYGYYPWSQNYGSYSAYPLTQSYDVPSARGLHRSMYGREYRATSDYGYRTQDYAYREPIDYRSMVQSGYGKRYYDVVPDDYDRYRTVYPRYSRYYGWY